MATTPLSKPSRKPASESEVVALHTACSPLQAESPYHAFACCPPTALFAKPHLWPGPEASSTTARLLWSREALYVCFELEGRAAPPLREADIAADVLARLEGGRLLPEQRTVLLDERVECFLWQPAAGEHYFAFEVNHEGRALTCRAELNGAKDFSWGSDCYRAWSRELPVGWGTGSSAVPSVSLADTASGQRVVVVELPWAPLGVDLSSELRVGLHRAQHAPNAVVQGLGVEGVQRLLAGMVWSSWIEPGDADVNFHRPAFFGRLVLAPPSASIDCSCSAARLTQPRKLRVLRSPRPSLEECPIGSLVVQGKYASLCGSDLPYFKASRAASCYWDRDGFCGHEVVGVVLESSSSHFAPGDAVLALPSSYFKAHASTKQEWFRPDVHGVLLESFPVRGGFCQVYTSHELYSYKLQECVPRMLAAQALGTVLRMSRRLGPVLGKNVVVLGQGQNGLLAVRLMSQLCAKHILAVEPVEYRRKLSFSFGATEAVAPEDAAAAVAACTGGRGADVVLEMVGHNQDTINTALDLVACAGTVVAFGVPDDKVYNHFEYTTFFRKNVTLVASVIPDPGVDFPEAVKLIEQGRFNTEGLFSHIVPLTEIERAFSMASLCSDGVVKIVVDLQ